MKTFIRRVLVSCLLLLVVWCTGFYSFITQIPTHAPASLEHADAIIVLTGDAGRIELGIDLLLAGKANELFVSGANEEVDYSDIVRLTPPHKRAYVRELSGTKIILGTNAQNTIGNAQETKTWLEGQQYNSIILVTSHYHIPRSLNEFSYLMPTTHVTYFAVIPRNAKEFFWWLDPQWRRIVLSEYYKYLISKLRHWALNNLFADIT